MLVPVSLVCRSRTPLMRGKPMDVAGVDACPRTLSLAWDAACAIVAVDRPVMRLGSGRGDGRGFQATCGMSGLFLHRNGPVRHRAEQPGGADAASTRTGGAGCRRAEPFTFP
ncbi:hypothetical protein GCM10023158_36010 [Gluconacetobacter tumulicola]